MNLTDMSSADLKQLQADVATAIEAREKQDLLSAYQAAEVAVSEFGFSLAEVIAAAGSKPRSKAAPKYRNPANPEETWTGRGRKPKWITEALEAGTDIASLEIQ